nr:hypothetical protein [Bacteroides acidifaciens]
MKIEDLLKSRAKLKEYDMLVKELIQVHTSHVDSCEPDRLESIGEILTFEERRAANIKRIAHEIAKLDEE